MAEQKQKQKLQYKNLGASGLKVSELCLGCMTFGENSWGMPTTSEETAFKLMDAFYEVGGNFLDTADIYGQGASEEIVGRWIQARSKDNPHFRESLVVATKCGGTMGTGPNDVGTGRKHIFDAVEKSLKRLQLQYIDLYQIHWAQNSTPLRETMSALNDLVRSGKVRYIGLSNFTAFQLQKALDICEIQHLEKYICLQPEYSLLCRSIEWEILPFTREAGIGVIPWSPLAGGWLSGKYKKDMQAPPQGTRVDWAEKVKWAETDWSNKNNDVTWNTLAEVEKIAGECKANMAQVSLRWLMQQPGVTAPIIGAKTIEQLKDNLGAAFIRLSEDQVTRLNKASFIKPPYPYSFLINVNEF